MVAKKKNLKSQQLTVFVNKFYKIINLILLVGIVAVGYIYLLQPKISAIRESVNSFLPQKQEEFATLEEYGRKLNALETQVADYLGENQSGLNRLKEILPTASDMPELLVQLDKLVAKSGFSFSSIGFSESELAAEQNGQGSPASETEQLLSRLKIVNITLNVAGGGYEEFLKLVANIESHVRLLDLVSANFSLPEASEGEIQGTYSLQLRTYYLPNE
jgi:Tfp pilus assembly protein PilO